jgi:hypothetical protein
MHEAKGYKMIFTLETKEHITFYSRDERIHNIYLKAAGPQHALATLKSVSD